MPLLLPYLPGRAFSVKGATTGAVFGAAAVAGTWSLFPPLVLAALFLWVVAASSYLGMNFTGSTPFTSLSGVLVEMRRSLPWQLGAVGVAGLLLIAQLVVRLVA
jgi:hypothetical protein